LSAAGALNGVRRFIDPTCRERFLKIEALALKVAAGCENEH
jgi:hypothetical protein